jgi:haloacetate dehalogenase
MFFDGFTLTRVDVPGGSIRLRHGGSGPPPLLLHGNPRSLGNRNVVAPAMAQRRTVIRPDLHGDGESHKPPVTPDHAPYPRREMPKHMITVMDHCGHRQFRVAGHNRGGRVAHRLALDHPDRITQLARSTSFRR